MFEPLFTSLFSSLFSPLIAAAQRIFITVNGVDEYFTFQNTKTFPDDFDLSIDAVLPTTATTVTLFGQTALADHYIKVLSTGFASINIDTSIVTSTVLATKDNKQRRYGVRVVGDDFIFTEDGATIDTVTDAVAAAKTLIINALCQSNGADFFNKTLSDPRLTDLTTASNSVSWQLNRALPATTEQSADGTNLLTYVGAPKTELFTFNQSDKKWNGSFEHVVNGDFSGGTTGWLEPRSSSSIITVSGNLRSTSDGAGTFGVVTNITTLTSDETYTRIFNVDIGTVITAGTFELRTADDQGLTANIVAAQSITGTDTYSIDFVAGAATEFSGVIVAGHDAGQFFELTATQTINRFIQIA